MSKINIKAWHFLLVFVILTVSSNIIWSSELEKTTITDQSSSLIELDNSAFVDSIASGTCFVLFYTAESDVCAKMEQNLNQLTKAVDGQFKFFKLNIEKFPGEYGKYAISGTPTTLVYKDGLEVDRIMGLVPVSNLLMIYRRNI